MQLVKLNCDTKVYYDSVSSSDIVFYLYNNYLQGHDTMVFFKGEQLGTIDIIGVVVFTECEIKLVLLTL